jgi:hypothetical protein
MDANSKNLVEDANIIDPKIQSILGTDKVRDTVIAIADEVGLQSVLQIRKLSKSVLYLFQKKISLDNYSYVLQNELEVDEKTALKAAVYVVKSFVVPHVSDFFPKGEEYYQKLLQTAKARGVDFSRRAKPAAPAAAKSGDDKSRESDEGKAAAVEGETTSVAASKNTPSTLPVAPQPANKIAPQMTDIKPATATTAKVVTKEVSAAPAEFQFASVADLKSASPRILDQEPADATKLIARFKEEIQDIANKSGATRPQIVAGWKESQIYKTYVDMGNDSLQQGKNIQETAAFRKAAGKPYLTEAQFNAVSEISRLLLH